MAENVTLFFARNILVPRTFDYLAKNKGYYTRLIDLKNALSVGEDPRAVTDAIKDAVEQFVEYGLAEYSEDRYLVRLTQSGLDVHESLNEASDKIRIR